MPAESVAVIRVEPREPAPELPEGSGVAASKSEVLEDKERLALGLAFRDQLWHAYSRTGKRSEAVGLGGKRRGQARVVRLREVSGRARLEHPARVDASAARGG